VREWEEPEGLWLPPRNPGGIIWRDGQMYVWDDDPAEDFGQLWIAVCIRCGNGPLDADGHMRCTDCEPRPDGSQSDIWRTVAHAAWISGGRMPF
jgi:hypothetical protein